MNQEIFIIRSLHVQNAIMLLFFGVALSFLIHSIIKKRPKNIAVFLFWIFLILWFFNSPFFGFSAVTVSPQGIGISYGILSVRNALLPLDSDWEIKAYLSGIRKNKRLYFISIGGLQSMKVKGEDEYRLLQKIGESIERFRKLMAR
ncbi:MAG: hypothetical protein ABII26_04485 [Pseudomonadota bacterium]